jgi:hypothetical protein
MIRFLARKFIPKMETSIHDSGMNQESPEEDHYPSCISCGRKFNNLMSNGLCAECDVSYYT